MNRGPLIFLGAFFTLVLSWGVLVVAPQMQLRGQQPVEDGLGGRYPTASAGMAQQGERVYRANGCYYCHTQNVSQDGYYFDVYVGDTGGASAEQLAAVIAQANPSLSDEEVRSAATSSGRRIAAGLDYRSKEAFVKRFDRAGLLAEDVGVKLDAVFQATGPDIERGWGSRASVAADHLFDETVMIGQARIGPDLSNVGERLPDEAWHYAHLYQPDSRVEGSKMPAYRYLFEERSIGDEASSEALTGLSGLEEGVEIVPTDDARTLVAYLLSLKTGSSLFEAPAPAPAEAEAQAEEEAVDTGAEE